MTTSELRSFPPVDDMLDNIRNIDGEALRSNAKRDLHVIGKGNRIYWRTAAYLRYVAV